MDKDFQILWLREAPVESASDIPSATLPMYGFIFMSGGRVIVEVNGEAFLLGGGKMLLIPPGKPFSIKYFDGMKMYKGFFTESFLKDASHPVLHAGTPVCNTFVREDALFLESLFKRMIPSALAEDERMVKSLLDLMLSHLHIDLNKKGSELASRFLDDIFKSGNHKLEIKDFAVRYQVSPGYLSRCIREYTNRSPKEWVGIARISMAKDLLSSTSLPVIDIAFRTGMEDQAYFARFFRKQVGMTPMEYRKKNSVKKS